MSPAIAARGETPFPEAGEGVVLRFTNADLKSLQQEFGPTFMQDASQRLDAWDLDYANRLLAAGCKVNGAPAEVTLEGNLDDTPISAVFEKLLDAIFLSYHGETFKQHVEKVSAAIAEMTRSGEIPPLRSPDTTHSTNSDTGLSDTGSIPRSSGD